MGTPDTLLPVLRVSAFQTILQAGLLAGVLDGLDAIVYFSWIGGLPVNKLFQHIASGALGMRSFQGGIATVLLGVGFHFLVAIGAATTYYLLTLSFPALLKKPVLYGPIFGVGVCVFMYNVVIPMSAAPPQPPASASKIINQLFTHTLFVGLTIALVVTRSASRSQR